MPKLNSHVHLYVDNVLVSLKPGDEAPDYITNPALFEDSDESPTPDESTGDKQEVVEDLGALKSDDLKKIAKDLGISTAGNKDELRERITAKRTESEDDGEEVAEDRAALIAQATELGFDVEESFTDAEIEALIASKE